MTSSMTSQGGLKVGPLYSFTNESTFFMITKREIAANCKKYIRAKAKFP